MESSTGLGRTDRNLITWREGSLLNGLPARVGILLALSLSFENRTQRTHATERQLVGIFFKDPCDSKVQPGLRTFGLQELKFSKPVALV